MSALHRAGSSSRDPYDPPVPVMLNLYTVLFITADDTGDHTLVALSDGSVLTVRGLPGSSCPLGALRHSLASCDLTT
jgi:hypothetical protein